MRRVLLATTAPVGALIVVGCSVVAASLDAGAGGGAGVKQGGEGGSDFPLVTASGASFGTSGGAGGAGGVSESSGAGSNGGAGGAAASTASASSSGVSGSNSASSSVSSNSASSSVSSSSASVGSSSSDASSAAASSSASSGAGGGDPGGCDPAEIVDTSPAIPALLSGTGLYQDIATKALAGGVLAFTPQFPLWSDGAEKSRWVHLPGCAKIDTSDMDHWEVPVGTKLWKEFSFGGARVETRYLHRWGPGNNDFAFQAYQWSLDGSDATPVPNGGVKNANGTTHDIPGEWECEVCHGHAPERVLGLGAIQLSHLGPGLTIDSLGAAGRLTVPSPPFSVPGDATTRAALGYLHGNCAHCHNPSPKAVWFNTPFSLKLFTAATTVAQTDAMLTAVGVAPEKFMHAGITHRITAGDPASSCVAYRMGVRGSTDAMPALGSEIVDASGVAAITAWISELAP